jgi:CheY-like chemotaxis protein
LPGIFRLTAALEALLKEITEKPKQFTPSVLRTLVNAIEYLPQLFAHQTQPVEESELSVYVMIVDDEEIARRAIAFGLEKADFRSLRIAEATTALKVLAENRFDLLLLDVEMPEMNGFELCAKLRALPMHTQTPVVFITTPIEFQRHLTSGATKGNDVIAKPFLYAELAVKALTLLLNRQLKK